MALSGLQLHRLAAAIIEECGEQAHLRAQLRAINLRSEGDVHGAEFWSRVAAIIAEMQPPDPSRRH